MPTTKENSLDNKLSEKTAGKHAVTKLGIIAGGGELPRSLLQSCDQNGLDSFVIALEGQADITITNDRDHMVAPLGAAGRMIETLKSKEIKDLILIGSVKRPSLGEIKPDLKTAGFLAKIGLSIFGDDGVLRAIRKELEHEGFRIHGIHEVAPDLLAQEGIIGRYKPSKADKDDIAKAFTIARELGRLDIGQAVIVQHGLVLGVEAAEGTDELIRRCGALKRKGDGGVLVKSCKPQQDRDLDLPTIGPDTVRECAAAGLAGIAVHAGQSLVFDREEIKKLADKHHVFVTVIDPDKL